MRIKISTSAAGEVYAELTEENPETAKAIWDGLPIEGRCVWIKMSQEAEEAKGADKLEGSIDPRMLGAVKPPPSPGILDLLEEKCCGLDVHKKTCTAAIISRQRPPTILEGVENSGPGIHHLHQRLIDEDCRTVVMESSGPYWTGIYDYLDLRRSRDSPPPRVRETRNRALVHTFCMCP